MSSGWSSEQVNAEVIKEEPLSAVDAGKRVRDFLRRRHVTELLSTEDYSRLYGLQEALLEQEESEKEPSKKRKRSRAKTEPEISTDTAVEPDRKKRRRRRSDVT